MSGELTQTELKQLTGLDKTTMVVLLDELEEDGLAERRPSAADRRARIIAVTKNGERRVAEAEKVLAGVQSDARNPQCPSATRSYPRSTSWSASASPSLPKAGRRCAGASPSRSSRPRAAARPLACEARHTGPYEIVCYGIICYGALLAH